MTCIVGYVDGGRVVIAGDSAGVNGNDITVRKDSKVGNVGEFVIGFTTSFRMGQILLHSFSPPPMRNNIDIMRYMVNDFVVELKRIFSTTGCMAEHSNHAPVGVFLVGVRGRLFLIDSDYQVGEPLDGFDSIGCGAQYAQGSLHTTASMAGMTVKEKIEKALQAAEHFSGGVRAPFNFVETPSLCE